MQNYVIDSCVFIKLFLEEEDSNKALELLRYINNKNKAIIVPSLFLYEIINIAKKADLNIEKIYNVLEKFYEVNLEYVNPNIEETKLALEISSKGNYKSGYPSAYDSIYHSIAINRNALFVTSDKKHYEKSKEFGNIILLKNIDI